MNPGVPDRTDAGTEAPPEGAAAAPRAGRGVWVLMAMGLLALAALVFVVVAAAGLYILHRRAVI